MFKNFIKPSHNDFNAYFTYGRIANGNSFF